MSNLSTPKTPDDFAQQQLQYAKLNSQLLAEQQMWMKSQAKKSSTKWSMIYIAIIFFALSRYILLRTEFSPVFKIFDKKSDAAFSCALSNDADPWNIVLSVAYPSFLKLLNTFTLGPKQPLSQDQGQFLWDAIRGQWIPTQDQIDGCPPCSALNLTPMHYMCGSILADWSRATQKSASDLTAQVKNDPSGTPWCTILTSDSKLLQDDQGLKILLTEGFWGIAKWVGTAGAPKDMYNYIFSHIPPEKGCGGTAQFASVASTAATFSMAGSALGPEGAAAGAVFGLGMGLLTPQGGCGKAACTIM